MISNESAFCTHSGVAEEMDCITAGLAGTRFIKNSSYLAGLCFAQEMQCRLEMESSNSQLVVRPRVCL